LVGSVLAKVAQAPPQAPPIVGPPFVPGSGVPGEVTRSQTTVVTSGPRNYSRP
jgi:hypothetical protein